MLISIHALVRLSIVAVLNSNFTESAAESLITKDADYDRCWSLATATLHFRFPAEPVADVFDAVIGNALATGDDGANARGAVGR